MQFEQTFKNIDDILHKDAGCNSRLDYVEQTSWVLFLKAWMTWTDQAKAKLAGSDYSHILKPGTGGRPGLPQRRERGKIDDKKAMKGDDLRDFVDQKLFPPRQFKLEAQSRIPLNTRSVRSSLS